MPLKTKKESQNYNVDSKVKKGKIDHLICLKTNIRETFIKNEHFIAIFFDLEKAYDTTWKCGVIKDLHDLGITGRLLQFIDGFLSKRKFRVCIDSTLSDAKMRKRVSYRAVFCP